MKRDEFPVWVQVSVRWSDMDALGHVNNARYFTYLESARIDLFSQLGVGAPKGPRQEGFALVSVTCNFRQQVRYPANVQIGTRITRIGTSSFHLEHLFLLEGGDTPVADAASVVVWTDYTVGRAAPLPEELRVRLEAMRAT